MNSLWIDLHELAQKLEKRVVFTGYKQHDELPYLYNLSDIAVLPSIWEEPAGLTNLEAMACGVPVITTNSGGIPEYVGESIVLNNKSDLESAIANSIMALLNDPERYRFLSHYGRSRVEKLFSKEDYINRLFECIEE